MAAESDDLSLVANIGVSAALLLSYSMITIAAGHGIAPLCLMVVVGLAPLPGLVAAWVGFGMVVVGTFVTDRRRHTMLTAPGIIALFASVWQFSHLSERPQFTLATAIPFVVLSMTSCLRLKRPTMHQALNEADHSSIRNAVAKRTNEPVLWIDSQAPDRAKVKTGSCTDPFGGQGHYFVIERDQGRWDVTSSEDWHA